MLISKTDKNTVYTFKTFAGEEIITRVSEENATTYTLLKPLVMIATPNGGFGLAPAIFSVAPTDPVVLNKRAVALSGKTESDIATQYLQKTTGLTLATSV
jgi:hypothetical protein